jgi:hypothetical protein
MKGLNLDDQFSSFSEYIRWQLKHTFMMFFTLSLLNVLDEGYSSNVTDEGYYSNVPDEG